METVTLTQKDAFMNDDFVLIDDFTVDWCFRAHAKINTHSGITLVTSS